MRFNQLSTTLNVIIVNSIIGLALSYFTILLPNIPDLNFLEAVGIYALYMPIHYALSNYFEGNGEK